jgi:hypothetical protein
MDETGLSTVPTKTPKVITSKGKSSVKIVSGEHGQTITVVCCTNASGNFVPPTFIFSRKKMRAELSMELRHLLLAWCLNLVS